MGTASPQPTPSGDGFKIGGTMYLLGLLLPYGIEATCCAMVLGENIGTTITANIAASVGNTQAKRAAMSHTIFNVFGVVWALIFFGPFLMLVGSIIELFGLPNPAAADFVVTSSASVEGTAALYGLSMLHTLFNTINTFILVWFTKYIEKAVTFIIRAPKNSDQELFRLKYISAGPLSTPELSSDQAFNEIIHFAEISRRVTGYIKSAVPENNPDKFEELRNKLVKYEEISDRIEHEIASFLNEVSTGDISKNTSVKVKAMYKIIGELESLGDSGEAISRILSRRNAHKQKFDEDSIKKLEDMVTVVDKAYGAMIDNLNAAHKGTLAGISNAYKAEESINDLRNLLRESEIEEIEKGTKNYQTSVYYLDTVSELERMGDFIINISQALERAYK